MARMAGRSVVVVYFDKAQDYFRITRLQYIVPHSREIVILAVLCEKTGSKMVGVVCASQQH